MFPSFAQKARKGWGTHICSKLKNKILGIPAAGALYCFLPAIAALGYFIMG
jgi:hypothetical protein